MGRQSQLARQWLSLITIFGIVLSPGLSLAQNTIEADSTIQIERQVAQVIPKKEVDYIYNLDDNTLAGLNVFAKHVAKKIESVIPCERIGITVIGLEVPHAHIHLIPINGISDMNFAKPKLNLSKQEFEQIAEAIRNA
mgnify:CR=1 FL=1